MKTLVIYESFFGNTEKIAQAISSAIGSGEDVSVNNVKDLKMEQLSGVGLLIVGSPTRAFRPTGGITAFLKNIPPDGLKGIKVASFDTRIATSEIKSGFLKSMAKMFGYAAKPIGKKLVKKGGHLILEPEGFLVKDSEGPLKEGELDRASQWAKKAADTAKK